MRRKTKDIQLTSYDDLFGNEEISSEKHGEGQIIEIPLTELHSFNNHPFHVVEDEKMMELIESIREYGVLTPGIARKMENGRYEIISGHRRKHASWLAGKETMPVFVREYDDDEATIIMADSNIQRENVLPSEKAKAYRMKYEAIKHQGKRAGGRTIEEMGEKAGESAKTIQRYIWLARLNDPLLEMIDKKKLGFTQGVDLSFLSEQEQEWVLEMLNDFAKNITTIQSSKLKEFSRKGLLTFEMVRAILLQSGTGKRRITINEQKISQYFSDQYSSVEIEDIILQLLEKWKQEEVILS